MRQNACTGETFDHDNAPLSPQDKRGDVLLTLRPLRLGGDIGHIFKELDNAKKSWPPWPAACMVRNANRAVPPNTRDGVPIAR